MTTKKIDELHTKDEVLMPDPPKEMTMAEKIEAERELNVLLKRLLAAVEKYIVPK